MWKSYAKQDLHICMHGLVDGQVIISQVGHAKWAGTKHDMICSVSARHNHNLYNVSADITWV
jgi:hypothetical protein